MLLHVSSLLIFRCAGTAGDDEEGDKDIYHFIIFLKNNKSWKEEEMEYDSKRRNR